MKKFKISAPVVIALGILAVMAILMVTQASQWSTTMDESPHIVSGYSYLKNQDYRLNPEHPPLIKMTAGFPLLFKDLNFPYDNPGWTEGTTLEGGQWGQWGLGNTFLHWAENDPISITFWARMGAMMITLLMGWLLFVWARKLYGTIAGLFVLILFSFSPNFLTHGFLANTDIGATFAFLLSIYFFFQYLQKQTKRNLIMAGVAFGIAQLMKFSLILIIPYMFVIAVMWVVFKERSDKILSAATGKLMLSYMGKLLMIGIIGLILVYPVYQFTVWNYPTEMQVQDTKVLLDTTLERPEANPILKKLAEATVWAADKPVLRSYGHFFLGHLMVFQRVSGGNTVYFLGDVATDAWASYFPIVFLMKVPVPLLVFLALSFTLVFVYAWKKLSPVLRNKTKTLSEKIKAGARIKEDWIRRYFIEVSFVVFIAYYWLLSIVGNLNIGVRHVLPTFPFLYILIAGVVYRWIYNRYTSAGEGVIEQMSTAVKNLFSHWLKASIILVLVVWYVISPFKAFPHTLAYFNELVGGPAEGHKYVTDSNLDWGQDLRNLVKFVEDNDIERIKLNYFGGGSPEYYLGDKYEWFEREDITEREGWIAVSATLLQEGRANPIRGFEKSTTHYEWLNAYEPEAVIGYSIFVYHIPEDDWPNEEEEADTEEDAPEETSEEEPESE